MAAVAIIVTVVTISVVVDSPEDTSIAPTDITPTDDDGSGSGGSEGSGETEQELISKIIQSLNLKPIEYEEENEENLISEGFIRLNHI